MIGKTNRRAINKNGKSIEKLPQTKAKNHPTEHQKVMPYKRFTTEEKQPGDPGVSLLVNTYS